MIITRVTFDRSKCNYSYIYDWIVNNGFSDLLKKDCDVLDEEEDEVNLYIHDVDKRYYNVFVLEYASGHTVRIAQPKDLFKTKDEVLNVSIER